MWLSRGMLKSSPLYQRSVPTPVQLSSNDWLLMEMADSDGVMVAEGSGIISSAKKNFKNNSTSVSVFVMM